MKHFPPLRTRRLTVQLKELTLGDCIALASMPDHLQEALYGEFLKRSIQSVSGIEDPQQWTVQERTLVIAHYMASVLEDGPDYSLGDGRYSDFLDGAIDYPDASVSLGSICDDHWSLRHLTGAMVESIERLQGELEGVIGLAHWILGGMAGQLVRDGEPDSSDLTPVQFDEWMLNRMRTFQLFPVSDFEKMLASYHAGRKQLHHLFDIQFHKDGLIVLPKSGADAVLRPARFPVSACLPQVAFDLAGQHD